MILSSLIENKHNIPHGRYHSTILFSKSILVLGERVLLRGEKRRVSPCEKD